MPEKNSYIFPRSVSLVTSPQKKNFLKFFYEVHRLSQM
ncbi:hypothetical protein N44_01646 [Microcystis aeruginosa NIES-44]|uniref:Uncharacterized protein n=1 Tax=Microcystis aeruginosa NIES-44 TaxID=449439 RepID=A0A0A1VTS1_MICAE|nr:hypothetical protein N44_01646 [Microcystis aeruginosa NIES-44]